MGLLVASVELSSQVTWHSVPHGHRLLFSPRSPVPKWVKGEGAGSISPCVCFGHLPHGLPSQGQLSALQGLPSCEKTWSSLLSLPSRTCPVLCPWCGFQASNDELADSDCDGPSQLVGGKGGCFPGPSALWLSSGHHSSAPGPGSLPVWAAPTDSYV